LDSADLYRDALLMPPLIYLVFCFLNFQGGPDTIPFFPFVGMFAAVALVRAGKRLSSWISPTAGGMTAFARTHAGALAISFVLLVVMVRGLIYRVDGITLEDQYKGSRQIAAMLAPDDKIYIHGPIEILTLLNLENSNPYVAFDSGADDYIARKKPDGFSSVIEEIESSKPKVVGLSRLGNVRHRDELLKWAQQHNDKVDVSNYWSLYIRKSPS
jgi:hypothetical protein